ncbi:hypothetical protein [Natronomonas gomsonensis]|uniref:hypothetical protein n=1 Tax=Natronomonas gomsonensis TaxID=1046043 RepID=UPI0015BBBE9F|nr:hypothetical protein [Natronomonas gomsonensis]
MTAPPGRDERLQRFEPPLAAAALLSTVVSLETNLLPSWWELGPTTLPPMSLYPVPLAAVVLAVAVGSYRRSGSVGIPQLAKVALASLVVFTAGYAVLVLNQASGGVFFAGLPPMLLGVLLSVTCLLERGLAIVRRVYDSAG